MRYVTKFLVGCFLFTVCVSSAYSQVKIKNITITPRWAQEPDIRAGSVVSRGSLTRWLQLDVSYTTVQQKGWLDNLVFKYDILLPKSATTKPVVLSGQVAYWSIKLDGETNHAQAFVHPKILERYAPGLRMKNNEIKDLRILLTILANDSPVGMGVYKMKSNTDPRVVKAEVDRALSAVKTFKGKDLVFGRDITPWGVLNTGYYELIRRKQ